MPADDLLLRRVVVAIYNPANGCFALDGDVLTVTPRSNIPFRVTVPHYFVSVENRTLRAHYGWVQETEPFTASGFLRTYGSRASDEEQEHVSEMLRSIQLVPAGEPVPSIT